MADSNSQQLIKNLDGLTSKILKLQKDMEGLNRNSLKYKETQKELNATMKAAVKVEKELARNRQFLNKNNKRHTKAIKDTDAAQKRFNATQTKTNKLLRASSKGIGGAIRGLGRYLAASAAITAGVGLLREVFVGSAKRAIQLEKALADVGAVAGLTDSELAKLKKTTLEVAGSTSLTQVEVVALQKELAKLGSSADEITALTKPVAILSQALGTAAGETAGTLKRIQNQFGLTAIQAGEAANVLVGAVNESALTMNDLATGLQYVGPLAFQAGLTFSETASFLGILADNGFRASRAGTGLRAILVEAAKSGESVTDMFIRLEKEGLNTARAVDLFTKRGAAAALTIVRNIEEIGELNFKLQESDRLFKANAKQMGTVRGQLDLLKSAYDKASTSLGEYITKTDFFISLIGLFDLKAGGMAAAYKFISENSLKATIAIEKLTEAQQDFQKDTPSDLDLVRQAFKAIASEVEISESKFIRKFNEALEETGSYEAALGQLQNTWNEELNESAFLVRGILDITKEQAQELDNIAIAEAANTKFLRDSYANYLALNAAAAKGTEINAEKAKGIKALEQEQLALEEERTAIYNTLSADKLLLTDAEQDRLKVIDQSLHIIEQQSDLYKSLFKNEEAANKEREKKDKERVKKEIQAIEDAARERIKSINEEAAARNELAVNADQQAEIELERVAAVSAVWNKAGIELSAIYTTVEESQDIIDKAAKKFEGLAEVLGSERLAEANSRFKQFQDEVSKLRDEFEETGDFEKYTKGLSVAQDDFRAYIETVIETFGITGLMADALRSLADDFDKLGVSINGPQKELEGFEKFLDDLFGDGLDIADVIKDAIKEFEDAANEFADTRLENTKNAADAELDVIKNRYKVEGEILKSQLDNQLITESQFRQKKLDLAKAQAAEENTIRQKIFEAEKQNDISKVRTEQAIATSEVFIDALRDYGFPQGLAVGALLSAPIAAASQAQISAINQRQFFPTVFEQGGMVEGPSHSEGGIPFTVQGQGGYEMEGGEFIVNKRSAALHKDLLERINSSTRAEAVIGTNKFANGGAVVGKQSDDSVNYLRAIAEFTGATANEVSKPMRAYVSDKDLNNNSRERQLRERNNRV